MSGNQSIESLSKQVAEKELAPTHSSGQQELLENQVNGILYP